MKNYAIFRLVCIVLLWVALCVILIFKRGVDFMALFSIIASGIIVFVPLYKKYKEGRYNK